MRLDSCVGHVEILLFPCQVREPRLHFAHISMARAKSERTRSKTAAIDDLTLSIEQLQDLLSQVEDLGREGFPYLDGARTRTELQLRECIKRAFGEKSPEFQSHRHHKLSVGSSTETKKTAALIKTLISSLEDKKIELQGLRSSAPAESKAAAMPNSPARPQMTLVPPTEPPPKPAGPSPVLKTPSTLSPSTPPATHAASVQSTMPQDAHEPNATMPIGPTATQPIGKPPSLPEQQSVRRGPESVQSHPQDTHSVTPSVVTVSPGFSVSGPSHSQNTPPTLQTTPSLPTPTKGAPPGLSSTQELSLSPPLTAAQPEPIDSIARTESFAAEQDPLELCRKLCTRFHAIARQLKLRGEYRSTLLVEDEIDAQDLLHALLRVQFDDISADEWMPGYTDGQTRTAFLLNHDRLAIVVKKTRSGLSIKDIAEQVRIDGERYRERGRCADLLCFIYDPEGRIGNPRGLENDLTSVSDHFSITVLVSPK